MRICRDQARGDEDIALTELEIYIRYLAKTHHYYYDSYMCMPFFE